MRRNQRRKHKHSSRWTIVCITVQTITREKSTIVAKYQYIDNGSNIQHSTTPFSIFNLSHWKREDGEIKWKGVYLFECSETGTMASKRPFHHTIANRLQLQAKGQLDSPEQWNRNRKGKEKLTKLTVCLWTSLKLSSYLFLVSRKKKLRIFDLIETMPNLKEIFR